MITKDDISNNGKYTLAYIADGFCIQFDTQEPLDDSEMEQAKTQFALILSISDRGREDIEKHMRVNGFDGVASCYRV